MLLVNKIRSFELLAISFLFTFLIIFLLSFGYSFTFLLMALVTIYIFIQKIQISLKITLLTLILSIFDNKFYYNLISRTDTRIFYILLPFLFLLLLFNLKYVNFCSIGLLSIFFFIYYSIAILIIESDMLSTLYAIKNWFFFYVPAYFIYETVKRIAINHLEIALKTTYTLLFSVMIFGIFQFFANSMGYNQFQFDYFNISPSAFFSERTWYGYLCVVVVALFIFMSQKKPFFVVDYFLHIGLSCIAVFLFSMSRNAFIGIFVLIFFLVYTSRFRNIYLLFFFGSGIFIFLNGFEFLSNLFLGNASSIGRLEAITLTIENYQSGKWSLWGNGYAFDLIADTSSTGTAIGAKSANSLMYFIHIFGIQILPILIIILINVFRKAKKDLNLIAFLSAWLTMSFFAPLHQNAFPLFSLGLICGLYRNQNKSLGANNK